METSAFVLYENALFDPSILKLILYWPNSIDFRSVQINCMGGFKNLSFISINSAVIYSALDEKELALQWLEKAYEDHDLELVSLKAEPQLYPLYDDPRFQDLLKRIGFEVSG